MKKSMLEGNLQILLRSQQEEIEGKKLRKQAALSCFVDPKPCEDLYPETVECKKTGMWYLKDKGSQVQHDRLYKVWAVYSRILPDKEEVDVETEAPALAVS